MATFLDVRNFLKTASVDDVGMWKNPDGPVALYGKLLVDIHIYSSKRECNISVNGMIIGKIYFIDDHEVSMIQVDRRGVADYDNQHIVDINTICDCEDETFKQHCVSAYKPECAEAMAAIIHYMANLGSNT